MFKTTKALANKVVDTAAGPIEAFDAAIDKQPELLVPLALVTVLPIALAIIGTTEIVVGRQKLKAERERTRQLKLRLAAKRHHHHGGPRGHFPSSGHPPFGPGVRPKRLSHRGLSL